MTRFVFRSMLWACLWACGGILASSAQASIYQASLELKSGSPIPGLRWQTERVPVQVIANASGVQVFAFVTGFYSQGDWTLALSDAPRTLPPGIQLPPSPSGGFVLPLLLTEPVRTFQMRAVSPRGGIEQAEYAIRFDQYDLAVRRARFNKRWMVAPALGLSYVTYSQTGLATLSQALVMLKLQGSYQLSGHWIISANGFITPIGLSSNIPGESLQFLGLNAKAGYLLLGQDPWQLTLNGGLYYTTTFDSGATLGYVDLSGPEFYPTLTRQFQNGDQASAYLKYSPISNRFMSLLTPSNREIAFGGGWTRPLENGHPLSLQLDLAFLHFFYQDALVETDSYSLSASYGF